MAIASQLHKKEKKRLEILDATVRIHLTTELSALTAEPLKTL